MQHAVVGEEKQQGVEMMNDDIYIEMMNDDIYRSLANNEMVK